MPKFCVYFSDARETGFVFKGMVDRETLLDLKKELEYNWLSKWTRYEEYESLRIAHWEEYQITDLYFDLVDTVDVHVGEIVEFSDEGEELRNTPFQIFVVEHDVSNSLYVIGPLEEWQ